MRLSSVLLPLLGIGHSDENMLQKKYLNAASEFIEIEGLRIHVRIEGQGEPIVLIHGVLASLHVWDAWVDELKKNYKVYRMDLPGFGMSLLPEGRDLYQVETAIPFVDRVLQKLGLDIIHIAGNSMGGYIAWNYAVKYPHKVKSLTVIDPVCYQQKLPFMLGLGAQPLINPFVKYVVPKFVFSQSLKQVYGKSSRLSSAVVQRYFELTSRKGNKNSMAYILRVFRRDAKNPALGDLIKDIKVPTLVMWGLRDRWVSTGFIEGWKQDVPHAKSAVYQDAGHVPMEEVPALTVNDFIVFLKEQRI